MHKPLIVPTFNPPPRQPPAATYKQGGGYVMSVGSLEARLVERGGTGGVGGRPLHLLQCQAVRWLL